MQLCVLVIISFITLHMVFINSSSSLKVWPGSVTCKDNNILIDPRDIPKTGTFSRNGKKEGNIIICGSWLYSSISWRGNRTELWAKWTGSWTTNQRPVSRSRDHSRPIRGQCPAGDSGDIHKEGWRSAEFYWDDEGKTEKTRGRDWENWATRILREAFNK